MPQMKGGDWTCPECRTEWTALIIFDGEVPESEEHDYVSITCDTPKCGGGKVQLYRKGLTIVRVTLMPKAGG